jgi:hypothetical protein
LSDPSGRAVIGVDLQPLACWNFGFEFRREHGYFSVVNVVCGQVEVSVTGCSLVQKIPIECGVSNERDREAPSGEAMVRKWIESPQKKKKKKKKKKKDLNSLFKVSNSIHLVR